MSMLNLAFSHFTERRWNFYQTVADGRAGKTGRVCRFYDFVVRTEEKRMEKLRYIPRNPVKRRTGTGVRSVGLEQFSLICVRREGPCSSTSSVGKMQKQQSCGADTPVRRFRLPLWCGRLAREASFRKILDSGSWGDDNHIDLDGVLGNLT